MPKPFPMTRQLFRSLAVPCASLGNHASGTEIVLPSLKSTLRVSSVTVMFSTVGTSTSTVEVRIPRLLKHPVAFVHQLLYSAKFGARKPATTLKANRIKPKLSDFIIALDMNVPRFVAIARVEKESVRTFSQNSWHWFTLLIVFTSNLLLSCCTLLASAVLSTTVRQEPPLRHIQRLQTLRQSKHRVR